MRFRPFRYGFLVSMRLFRVVLTTSNEWGAVVTKLNVPADWKGFSLTLYAYFFRLLLNISLLNLYVKCAEWQIYALLLGLFLVSAVVFYIFMQNSDSFWNFPLGKVQPGAPKLKTLFHDSPSSEDQNNWNPFGPVDMWRSPWFLLYSQKIAWETNLVSKYEWNPPNTHVLSLLFCFLLLLGKSCMSLNCLYYVFFGPNFFQSI